VQWQGTSEELLGGDPPAMGLLVAVLLVAVILMCLDVQLSVSKEVCRLKRDCGSSSSAKSVPSNDDVVNLTMPLAKCKQANSITAAQQTDH
jgi:hypothetical protein